MSDRFCCCFKTNWANKHSATQSVWDVHGMQVRPSCLCEKSFNMLNTSGVIHSLQGLFSEGFMASSEFVEELLIQCVALVTAAGWHEDVSANILVDDLAVSVHTAKSDVYVSIKLNGHLSTEKADSEYQTSMASDINKYSTLFYVLLTILHYSWPMAQKVTDS